MQWMQDHLVISVMDVMDSEMKVRIPGIYISLELEKTDQSQME